MKYYTIQNGGILTAETRQALERFYNNVLELPEDYAQGKYIVVDGEFVLNPNWEEEKEEQEKQRRNSEIDSKIKELCELSILDLLKGNTKNIKTYNEVINSLAECKF